MCIRDSFENLKKCYDLEDASVPDPEIRTRSEEGVKRWEPGSLGGGGGSGGGGAGEEHYDDHMRAILELSREIYDREENQKLDLQQKRLQLRLLQNKRRLLSRSRSHNEFNYKVSYGINSA